MECLETRDVCPDGCSGRIVGHPTTTAKRSRQPSARRLDADMIVHGAPDSLLAAQVTFRRLN